MWLDWLVFCDYGFSVSAHWCPLATPTVLPRFLLPWTWGISSRLLQQSAVLLLTLDRAEARRLRWTAQKRGQEELFLTQGQGLRPRGATPCLRLGVVPERSNPTSKEWWLHGHRRAKRSYSKFKIRRGCSEEIPLVQGKGITKESETTWQLNNHNKPFYKTSGRVLLLINQTKELY